MAEDLLLTELCKICHTKPYKYCCPRCSSRTCSLPCLKRHKQWASCNGVRDPAAYVKRSDLATPKGLDHDYNYLTSIERQIDNAERNAESRGILLFDATQKPIRKKRRHPADGKVLLAKAIEQCRVVVDRAPQGMSRQKQNATRWDKRKRRVVWTVEWVHKNGSREIGICPETTTIDAAYAELATSNTKDTAAEAGRPTKKQKPNAEIPRPPVLAMKPQSEHVPTSPVVAQVPQASTPDQPSAPTVHFYLLLPSTPTPYRVLIPVSPTDTLSTALRDRLVLEFPTIYALKQPPDKLPTGFTTEEEYLRGIAEKGNIDKHLDGILNWADAWENDGGQKMGERGLDERALRDVLKKDLVREVE